MTPVANFDTSTAGIVDTDGKFASSFNSTTPDANFSTGPAGVIDTGGK
jgi:hypothetical protein